MRIAFVLRSFGGPGGTEKYAADLAGFLAGEGVRVVVHCVRADPAAVEASGVTVRRLPGEQRGWAGERAFLLATRSIDHSGADLVQGFGRTVDHDVYRAGGGVHAAWLAAEGADSWSRWLRGKLSPRERWALAVDREAMTAARVVVCNSAFAAEQVVRIHGLPEARVRVVRNGVDGERFSADPEARAAARQHWGVPENGRVALFLGTGFHRKGLATAVQAFARVAGPADRLVVIGRDARAARRLQQARGRLGDRLVAHGAVVDPERWIPGADATILPTRYDAAANTTLEALSCGVPPVTSAQDGSAEVVPDPALVVEHPADAEGFAAALGHAWQGGPGLALRCREAAAEWTVARNGKTMLRVYRELIDG